MFDSFAPYVLMVAAVVMLLVVIFAARKWRAEAKSWRTVKEREVVTGAPETVLEVEEAPATSKRRVKWLGVLTIDTTDSQVCEQCGSVWLGELIRSGKCGKCGGRLLIFVAEGAPQQYIVVSEDRLTKLLTKLWVRAE